MMLDEAHKSLTNPQGSRIADFGQEPLLSPNELQARKSGGVVLPYPETVLLLQVVERQQGAIWGKIAP